MSNYIRKPIIRKKPAGAVDLEEDEADRAPKRRGPPPKPHDRSYTYDDLGEQEAMLERNKEKNYDGKRIRGLDYTGFGDLVT